MEPSLRQQSPANVGPEARFRLCGIPARRARKRITQGNLLPDCELLREQGAKPGQMQ
ncbi:hypothetical protein [Rhodobacter sp. CZR27]|uniref:hypothetical protein n=1 Tax=Rhodobacter sp. CZR27 TaxID=2033869 RepID=UPI0012FD334B|nr:hypothetical protein [Rhodobacter sp. CZR27]